MTNERRQELANYRQQMSLKDQQLEVAGQLIDGIRQIEDSLAKAAPVRDAIPEMVMAGQGKGKKVAVRR
jgi:small subunit ribosomal protein S35